MTDQFNNPLLARQQAFRGTPAFVSLKNGEQVPTEIYAYCSWLNAKERRYGRWIVIGEEPNRSVDWREEIASPDWLRERGLAPAIGKAA